MNKLLKVVFIMMLVFFSCSLHAGDEWKLRKDQNGIQVYTREQEDSPVYMYKVRAKIDCQQKKVFEQVIDFRENLKYMELVDSIAYINQSIYSASKHALAGFTKVLAREVQDDHIRVHLISPGGVYTELVAEMRPDLNEEELIQTRELADIVLFLINYKGKGTIDEVRIRRFNSTPFG